MRKNWPYTYYKFINYNMYLWDMMK